MGAQVPGAAFAGISKLSDALSVRGNKKYAMRCRKKPRDALSVRRLDDGVPPEQPAERDQSGHPDTQQGHRGWLRYC